MKKTKILSVITLFLFLVNTLGSAFADVSISKTTLTPATVYPGDQVSYRVDFSNSASGTGNITISDILPAWIAPASAAVTGTSNWSASLGFAGNTLRLNNVFLGTGESGSITFTGTVVSNSNANASYTNTATMTGSALLPLVNNSANASLTTISYPTITASASSNPVSAINGTPVSFTFNLPNYGSNRSFRCTLPADITYVSNTFGADCRVVGGINVPAGVATCIVNGTINRNNRPARPLNVTASVAKGNFTTPVVSVPVQAIPDLYMNGNVNAGQSVHFIGDTVLFTLNYGNRGSLNGGVSSYSVTSPGGFVTVESANVMGISNVPSTNNTLALPNVLTPDQAGQIIIQGRVNRNYDRVNLANNQVCITATIAPSAVDFSGGNNATTICATLQPLPDLSVDKCMIPANAGANGTCIATNDPALKNLKAGDVVQYKMTVRNIGTTGAGPVTLTDTFSNLNFDTNDVSIYEGPSYILCGGGSNPSDPNLQCNSVTITKPNASTLRVADTLGDNWDLFSTPTTPKEYTILIKGTITGNPDQINGLNLSNTGSILINGDPQTDNGGLEGTANCQVVGGQVSHTCAYVNNTTGVTHNVGGLPNFITTKTCAPHNVLNIGDPISCTIVIVNTGTKASTGFSLTDVFPYNFTGNFSVTVNGSTQSNVVSNKTLNVNLPALAIGASHTVVVNGSFITGNNLLYGQQFTNTATVVYNANFAGNLVASDNIMYGDAPDLWVQVNNTGSAPHFSGDFVSFELVYGNTGIQIATGVYIDGNIPTQLKDLVSNRLGIQNLSNVTYRINETSDLSVGFNTRLTIQGTLNANYAPGTSICLGATIHGSAREVMTNNASTACRTVEAVAQLGVTKFIADPSNLAARASTGYLQTLVSGNIVNYRLNIYNNGNRVVTGINLTDLVPASLAFVDAKLYRNGYVTTQFNTPAMTGIMLNPAESAYVILQARVSVDTFVPGGLSLINTGTILIAGDTGLREDLEGPANPYVDNTGSSVDLIGGRPDIWINKTCVSGCQPIRTGDQIVYQITYGNSGDRLSNGFTITDTFPVEFTGYSFSPVTVVSLAAGATGRVLVTGYLANVPSVFLNGQIRNGYTFFNTGTITGFVDTYADPLPNIATAPIMIGDAPNLWINVTGTGVNPTHSGDYVLFDVVMGNSGSIAATGVSLSGFFANISGLLTRYFETIEVLNNTFIRSDDSVNFYTNASLWSALSSFAPGTTHRFTIGGKLRQNFAANSQVCMTARLAGAQIELLNDNTDTDCITIDPIADLQITAKYVTGTDLNNVQNGSIITYRIDFVNNGSRTISGYIQDTLPAELSYVAGSRFISSAGWTPTNVIAPARDVFFLGSGERGYVLMQTRFNGNIAATGLCITNSAMISGYTVESDYTNNSGTTTDCIPALADLTITKDRISSNPTRSGNLVGFRINVTHNGGRPAQVTLMDVLPVHLSNTSSTNTILSKCPGIDLCRFGMMSSGQTATIYVTGTLRQQYPVFTMFTNTGLVQPNTGLVSTTGYVDIATGMVERECAFDVSMRVQNISNATFNAANPKQAVSGNYLVWTINYTNAGNTTGTINSIQLTNLFQNVFSNPFTVADGPGVIRPGLYTRNNVATNVPMGSGGSIVISGTVITGNFDRINPSVNLSFVCDLPLENLNASTSGLVVEPPAVCGDGVMTRNERCDTRGNVGVLIQGQECQNQNGVCVLVTTQVINRACMDFGVNLNPLTNQMFLGNRQCADSRLTPRTPRCESLTGNRATLVSTTGLDVTLSCTGRDLVPGTYVSLDCGSGAVGTRIYSGFGLSTLTGLCSYATSGFNPLDTIAKCTVGLDTGNLACQMAVNLDPDQPMSGDCKSLTADDGIVLLTYDDNNAEGRFTCRSVDTTSDATIKIDCDNGKGVETEIGSSFTHTCKYKFDDKNPGNNIHNVTCSVNGNTNTGCQESINVDEPILGYCGNGIVEGYEDCDLGDNNKVVGNYLDSTSQYRANSEQKGQTCSNCSLSQEDVACLSVNTSISVMTGELLPFAWRLEKSNFLDTCDPSSSESGPIKDTMECTFNIYNGVHKESDNDPIRDPIVAPCDTNANDVIFNYFNTKEQLYPTFAKAFGKRIFTPKEFFEEGVYGEYKITLASINYDYCDKGNLRTKNQLDRVCSVNFAVTKPYLVQKSSLGATPKSNLNLGNFLDNFGVEIQSKLQNTMIINNSAFNGVADSKVVNTLVDTFAAKYEKLAVTITSKELGITLDGLTIKKVPGKQIYFVENTKPTKQTLPIDVTNTVYLKPFTMITKKLDVVINGNLDTANGMFVVRGGDIGFNTKDCNTRQFVRGIFIADNFLPDANPVVNDDKGQEWCDAGGLTVRGVLIGKNITELAASKRSHLNGWFMTKTTTSNNDDVNLERRDKIFNGASLLIEYSAALWNSLPPGAEDFTQALQIYKR